MIAKAFDPNWAIVKWAQSMTQTHSNFSKRGSFCLWARKRVPKSCIMTYQ